MGIETQRIARAGEAGGSRLTTPTLFAEPIAKRRKGVPPTPEQRAAMGQRRREANAAHKALVLSVIALLHSLGCEARKMDNGNAWLKVGQGYKPYRYGTVGFPDVDGTITPTGVRICVECKTGAATPRPEQRIIMADLVAAGALVYVVQDRIDQQTIDLIRRDIEEVRAMHRWSCEERDRRKAAEA